MKILTLKKVLTVSILLSLLLILVILISVTMGSVKVPPLRSIRILFESILGLKGAGSETERTIILSLRLPRAILAGFVGAGLSVSGADLPGSPEKSSGRSLYSRSLKWCSRRRDHCHSIGARHLFLGPSSGLLLGSSPDHTGCLLFWKTGWENSSQYPLVGRSHHRFLSLSPHHVFHFCFPEGRTPYHHLLVDGRLQFLQCPGDSNHLSLYFIGWLPALPPLSPFKPHSFWGRKCHPIRSQCRKIETGFLPLSLFDHCGISLRMRSDRFRGSDHPPFSTVDLRS